jgi:hypothetical protein
MKTPTLEWLRDALNAAIIIVFSGILLTFLTFILFNTSYGIKIEDDFFDGEDHEGLFFHSLSEIFYKNTEINRNVSRFEFKLFSEVRGDRVIIGRDGYLFEVKNPKNDYNFWKDCSGALTFSDEESKTIAENIKNTTEHYKSLGIDYYIAVIPNSQTVYHRNLPKEVILPKGTSRRPALLTDLESNGIRNYIDTTINLERYSSDYILFNNTENSPTPLGAYFAYDEICKQIIEDGYSLILINRSDLQYQVHLTKSRELARLAGVSDHVDNVTVSLTSAMRKYFVSSESNGRITTKSTLYPVGSNGPRALISSSSGSDLSSFTFFFASSFGEMLTESSQSVTDELLLDFAPQIYIQIIHENELGKISELIAPK